MGLIATDKGVGSHSMKITASNPSVNALHYMGFCNQSTNKGTISDPMILITVPHMSKRTLLLAMKD